MRIKGRSPIWFIFAGVSVAAIFIVAAVIVGIIFRQNSSKELGIFPEYSYEQYIDRTEGMNFSFDAGAQLYEAEGQDVKKFGCVTKAETVASGGRTVMFAERDSLVYEIECDAPETALIAVRVAYVPGAGSDTSADNLFRFTFNGNKCDIRSATVRASESFCNFYLTKLCRIDLHSGYNNLEFYAIEGDFSLDYIVIMPQTERKSTENTIGFGAFKFDYRESSQIVEVENAQTTGGVFVNDSSVSNSYYLRHDVADESVNFHINSTENVTTLLSVRINNYGRSENFSDICEAYVNDEYISTDAVVPVGEQGKGFTECTLARVELVKGDNVIRLSSLNGRYALDCIVLNRDINFSPSALTLRYEAEDARLYGTSKRDYNTTASEWYNVSYNSRGSKLEFDVNSVEDSGELMLSVAISYVSIRMPASGIFSVAVNGIDVDLTGIYVDNMGSFSNFKEIALGKIQLKSGKNTIVITSKMGYHNFDYITLSTMVVTEEGGRFEAEKAALTGDAAVEHSYSSASGGADVGYNNMNSSINFTFYSESDYKIRLIGCFSSMLEEDVLLDDVIVVVVNGESLDLGDNPFFKTGGWSEFKENFIGEISVRKGINTLKITSQRLAYNLDYIAFAPVSAQ